MSDLSKEELVAEKAILPNFLIVGVAKAGTTSLYHWLKSHPEVFMPRWKEPLYFADYFGLDWKGYTALFQPGAGKNAVGEASAAYLANPVCAQRIRNELGDVKIVMVLRNPAERCFSHYSHGVMFGYEWIKTFDEALAQEDVRFNSPDFRANSPYYLWDYMYFRCGLYHDMVKQYLDLFSHVKIYFFEDLVQRPSWLYADLCRFLGIDDNAQVEFEHHNASRCPRFIPLQHKLKMYHLKTRFRTEWYRPLINKMVTGLLDFNTSLGRKIRLAPEQRMKLNQAYKDDVAKLGQLIGRDLSHWTS